MFCKMAFVGMAVVAGTCLIAGCAGPMGKGEGDSCGAWKALLSAFDRGDGFGHDKSVRFGGRAMHQ